MTFLVSGLWHGASWNFVVWGGLHGIYQIIGDVLKPIRDKTTNFLNVKTECMSYAFGKIIITFFLTCFAWIFFRIDSLSDAIAFIGRILTRPNLWVLYDQSLYTLGLDRVEMNILAVSLLVLLLVDFVRYFKMLQWMFFWTGRIFGLNGELLLLLFLP